MDLDSLNEQVRHVAASHAKQDADQKYLGKYSWFKDSVEQTMFFWGVEFASITRFFQSMKNDERLFLFRTCSAYLVGFRDMWQVTGGKSSRFDGDLAHTEWLNH